LEPLSYISQSLEVPAMSEFHKNSYTS
jgi:hypothetical protein